jgi:trans-aconitate 2-methyltransferase
MRWDAEKYDEVKSPQVDAGRELITMAKVRGTDSILDIGCGTGKLTAELARLASKGFVTGIDPSHEMLRKAGTVSGDLENIRLINMQAQLMGFSEMFDLVFSNSTLQWIKEQRKVVGLMHNSLKKGGRIACQLPAKNFCKEFFGYAGNAIALLGFEKYYRGWRSPWYLPDKEEYEQLLKDVGFQEVEVFYRDYQIVFDSINGVIQWWASAGLRPYLEMLPPREQEYFKYAVAMNYENNRTEKGIEFGFRRLFAFAVK